MYIYDIFYYYQTQDCMNMDICMDIYLWLCRYLYLQYQAECIFFQVYVWHSLYKISKYLYLISVVSTLNALFAGVCMA